MLPHKGRAVQLFIYLIAMMCRLSKGYNSNSEYSKIRSSLIHKPSLKYSTDTYTCSSHLPCKFTPCTTGGTILIFFIKGGGFSVRRVAGREHHHDLFF